MTDDQSSLLALLRSKELWRELGELLTKLRGPSYDAIEDAITRASHDFRVLDNQDVRRLFQRLVIDRLPKPAPLTANDLAEKLRHHLAGITFDGEIASYEQHVAVKKFLAYFLVETDTSGIERDSVDIDLGDWSADKDSDGDRIVEVRPLWESEYFVLDARAKPNEFLRYDLVGLFAGWCSGEAMASATQWMSRYTKSIVKTVKYSTTTHERKNTVFADVMDLSDKDLVRFGPDGLSPLSFIANEDSPGGLVFDECLKAIAKAHLDDIDEFTRRLANAVQLLSDADSADTIPVALTLCFAAIEAMICEDPRRLRRLKRGITNDEPYGPTRQIKEYVPTLLSQNVIMRENRRKVVGGLYRERGKIIHGKKLDHQQAALQQSRRIAAGVVRAAIQWRANRGESGTWIDFFLSVDRARFKKLILADVPDLSDLLPA